MWSAGSVIQKRCLACFANVTNYFERVTVAPIELQLFPKIRIRERLDAPKQRKSTNFLAVEVVLYCDTFKVVHNLLFFLVFS